MTMAEMKLNKGRRKKEAARSTDDVVHGMAAMPASGVQHSPASAERVINGGSHERGTHEMDSDHRINREHAIAIGDDERRRMIAEAAYYRAQRRGFTNGSPETDWLEAEAEIVALLASAGMRA
jgi:hypothetical protein